MIPRLFDGHCDTAVHLHHHRQQLASNPGHISLAGAMPGWAQFFAFCTAYEKEPEVSFAAAYRFFRQELSRNEERIALCTSGKDAEEALTAGKFAAFLSIEGAEAISCDPGRLEEAWALGIRMIAPTWNRENALSGTCVTGGGLTAQGREFVRRAQKLGMLVDVSHISEQAFWDICDIAEKPILASHSNAAAQCRHVRNLTDSQFKALCDLGGTAGVNLYAPFLNESGQAAMEDVYRHIDHFLQLGGEGHIALGADFDGCETLPEGISGIQDMKKLASFLLSRGIGEGTLETIYSTSLWKVVTSS